MLIRELGTAGKQQTQEDEEANAFLYWCPAHIGCDLTFSTFCTARSRVVTHRTNQQRVREPQALRRDKRISGSRSSQE